MAIMTHRCRSYVKASMVLMRADYLFIQNYIRSFKNINLRSILLVRSDLKLHPPTYVSNALASYKSDIYILHTSIVSILLR